MLWLWTGALWRVQAGGRPLTPEVCSVWALLVEALSPLDDMTSLRLLPLATLVVPLRRPRPLLACSECSFSLRDWGSSCVRFAGGIAR